MAKEAAQPQQDQSMEEILQSIKRIIAEEGDSEPAAPEKSSVAAPAANGASSADVLELTDIVDEDESAEAMELQDEAPAAPLTMESAAPSVASSSAMDIDSLLEVVEKAPMPARTPLPAASSAPPKDVLDDIDTLLSSEAAKASSSALKALHSAPKAPAPAPKPVNPGMPFRSGNTVEDLAMEALRPMLKDWLDANLPSIVERLVEREVKKISNM